MTYLARYAPGLGNTIDMPRSLRRIHVFAVAHILELENGPSEG